MTVDGAKPLAVSTAVIGATPVFTVEGVLDSGSYLGLRNAIAEAALDRPPALIVDVTRLCVPSPSAWAVFTSASWHVSRNWPHVPVVVVSVNAAVRDTLDRVGITRYVPVYPSTARAIDAIPALGARRYCHAHIRRRADAELESDPTSLARARQLVADALPPWSRLIPVAKLVVTELVENVLVHTDSAPHVTVETDGATVTIAVRDSSTAMAARREDPSCGIDLTSGLNLVALVCKAWGNLPTASGKAVWAVAGHIPPQSS